MNGNPDIIYERPPVSVKMAADETANGTVLVKTLYPFKGSNNDELNFQKGDVITVTQAIDGGWWEGTLDGVTGWFPSNYVKELRPDDNSGAKSPVTATLDHEDDDDDGASAARHRSMRAYRNVVLNEIVESEKSFVNDLHCLHKTYLQPLDKSDILPSAEYRTLVGNLGEVRDCHRKLLKTLEECAKQHPKDQKVGGAFMLLAPRVKDTHAAYCANHPRAVALLEKYKDELDFFMERNGAPAPGCRALTQGLSLPFRRLEKYRGLLREMERHIEESHADRGDVQRATCVYRDISSDCANVRRQKEMELEVLEGNVRGWEGEEVSKLGEILSMSMASVATDGREKNERYLVLFPETLLLLSVSPTSSTFAYEGKLPLAGIDVSTPDDAEDGKNAFRISGAMIEPMTVYCRQARDRNRWVEMLRRQIARSSNRSPPDTTSTSVSPCSRDRDAIECPYVRPNRVWVLTCLRPSPPFVPNSTGSRPEAVVAPADRPRDDRKNGDGLAGEDTQILRVIEAYCASAKARYTINSAVLRSPQVLIAEEEKIITEVTKGDRTVVEEKSLVDTVYALKDQVDDLRKESATIAESLDRERQLRRHLQDVVKRHLIDRSDVVWQD